jgi:hypothetical protein
MGAILFLVALSAASAQDLAPVPLVDVTSISSAHLVAPAPDTRGPGPAATNLPQMSPEVALNSYFSLAKRQLVDLGAYSDITTIEADLPDSKQHGKYELRRYFQAPRSLVFAALHFAGDGFVKTNVIARVLQSEVDHVQKGEGTQTAISAENYKFSYRGFETIDGRTSYIYQVKPRKKRQGLFKGQVLIDSTSGRLRRAEGEMVKSPSFFIKHIHFVQEYADCGPFSLPAHIHSEAKTRLVGRAVVDMSHTDYRAITLNELQSASSAAGVGGSTN